MSEVEEVTELFSNIVSELSHSLKDMFGDKATIFSDDEIPIYVRGILEEENMCTFAIVKNIKFILCSRYGNFNPFALAALGEASIKYAGVGITVINMDEEAFVCYADKLGDKVCAENLVKVVFDDSYAASKYEYHIIKDRKDVYTLYGDTNKVVYDYLKYFGGRNISSKSLQSNEKGCRISMFESKSNGQLYTFTVKRYSCKKCLEEPRNKELWVKYSRLKAQEVS